MRLTFAPLLFLFVSVCGLFPLGALAQNSSQLNYASTKDIRDINPHLYSGEMAAQNMVFESLVINTDEGVKPFLAQSWMISDDGKTYTFQLRKDVSFSDGERFNADAAKKNIDAVLANYQRHAWLELVRQIDKVNVTGEYELQLILKEPYYPTLVELGLTRPFRFISPKDFINGQTREGVSAYSGTGPWVLEQHNKNQYAIFAANDHYWGQRPKIDRVQWQVIPDRQSMLMALQKGDVQLIFGADGDMLDMDTFEVLQNTGKFTAVMSQPIASRALVLNSSKAITGERAVRQALQYAVDKKAIAEGVMDGTETVADTLMSRHVPYADIDLPVYHFDPAKASALLEQAGWVFPQGQSFRSKAGKPLQLMLSYNSNNAAEREIAEVIQEDFKQVGVDLKIVGEEKQSFLDRQKSGDFDIQYSLSWGTPYDPQSYVSSFRIPAHADYQGQKGLASKPKIDQMIGELLVSPDEKQRQALYQQLFTLLAEEGVYIPLTYSRTKAIYSNQLRGVSFNPSQYEIPFEKMYFEPKA
ncbi:nickel ABC transporter, nickel/metallophore periplasmic binding protein [Yersinia frederiksenii]|uniref:nickel ABC transporter substrate-binding protein n=1 Tax=Yersinia frederiksenii TaxID=29484 RepID=UPI000B494892|nr:nickel ABC transporter substrate-binding protein [Yersinia frederiksenii]OWF70822.1 nickel ABC transporter, nickel/metallophore periplasmic binding protein [Yersinia frederiksenii]